MRLLGFEIARAKALAPVRSSVSSRDGWWPVIRESFTGAWQRNIEVDHGSVLSYPVVYSCVTLIASDIAKLRIRLIAETSPGVWTETSNPAYSPVLRAPNPYQNQIQFSESWMLSKLLRGNTYVLKQRDQRNVVVRLDVLNPDRVKTLISDDGSIFYELQVDNLGGVAEAVVVPAREVIHDRWNTFPNQLVGVSPIFAAGLPAEVGRRVTNNSAAFFGNASKPGGLLIAPSHTPEEEIERLRNAWEQKYSGPNAGRIAILEGGLSYQQLSMSAEDAQLIEQLRWNDEKICSCFHVPAYMVGVGPAPTYNNIEALNQTYYSQCLQKLIEDYETSLDQGLMLPNDIGVELDIDNLLRMDTVAKVNAAAAGIGAGLFAPNEQRARFNLPPVEGGDTPYMQQQNYSLAALNRRDQQDDPFTVATPPAETETEPEDDDRKPDEIDAPDEEKLAAIAQMFTWELKDAARAIHGPQ